MRNVTAVLLTLTLGACATDSPVIKPADLGDLAKECQSFHDIAPADIGSEKLFLAWYGENASRFAECSARHDEVIRVLRKNGSIK